MIDTHHVSAKLCEHLAYAEHLTGLVLQFDAHRAGAAALGKSAMDDTVKDGNVNVSAAYHADCLLAFHRHLIEHHGSHACGTGSFCHHLLALDELQDGSADLVLADCDNLVYVLRACLEGYLARLLYGDAVGNGRNGRQCFLLVIVYGAYHAGCSSRLYAIYLHLRIERLDGKSDA